MRSAGFHLEAESELIDAARYYADQADGLGEDFLAAVQGVVRRIGELPESGRPFGHRLRRLLVPGFPYAVIYRPEADGLLVVAVAHVRRRPGFWQRRA